MQRATFILRLLRILMILSEDIFSSESLKITLQCGILFAGFRKLKEEFEKGVKKRRIKDTKTGYMPNL